MRKITVFVSALTAFFAAGGAAVSPPFTFVRSWATATTPEDVTWGYDNCVYVAAHSSSWSGVYKYSAEGRFVTSWAVPPTHAMPRYVEATPLYVYAADAGEAPAKDGVDRYDHNGAYLNRVEIKAPAGVSCNESGYVLVLGGDFVRLYGAELTLISSWRCPGERGIGCDRMTTCYVGAAHGRILKYTISGSFLGTIPVTGTPYDVAVSEDGYVFVSASPPPRVDVFSPEGDFVGSFGNAGAGALTTPRGLDTAVNGDVYVVDQSRNAVFLFRPGVTVIQARSFGRVKALFP